MFRPKFLAIFREHKFFLLCPAYVSAYLAEVVRI